MRNNIARNVLILYIDEVMFTQKSVMKREYSNLGTNIEVNRQNFNLNTTVVLAGIT